MNNKGFTLVEILASVSLLAVLSGVAIAGVSKYIETSKKKAYKNMEAQIFDAAQSYIEENSTAIPTSGRRIEVQTLTSENYLGKLTDPAQKQSTCNSRSYVFVTKQKGTNGALDKYTYNINLICSTYSSHHYEGNTKVNGVIYKG